MSKEAIMKIREAEAEASRIRAEAEDAARAKIEENAKRDLGMIPPKEYTPGESIRGKFVEATTHLKRRKESNRKPLTYGALLIGIAVLSYILHYLVTGELTF